MKSASAELKECFADVQLQRHWILPRLADQELLRQDYRIYHAVDTNIFTLYLNPRQHAVAGEGQVVGVGEVFRSDDRPRKESIAAALGEFIWNQLQPDIPLLLLPPVIREIDNSVKYYVDKFEHRDREESVELTEIQRQLQQHNHELSEEDLQTLRHAVMVDSGAAAAMRRMTLLFSRSRLRSTESNLAVDLFDDQIRFGVQKITDVREIFDFIELKDAWLERLQKIGRLKSAKVEHDAETMARLELYNNRLSRIPGGKTVLLYITGDNSLFDAGETYQVVWDSKKASFASHFLRHPRAYLNEPEVLSPRSGSSGQPGVSVTLAEWLQVLLGWLKELGEVHIPNKGKIVWSEPADAAIKGLAKKNRQTANDIQTEWKRYEAAASLDVPDSYMQGLSSAAAEGKDSFLTQLKRLRPQIQKKKDRAWEDCFYVSTSARFILQVIESTSTPAREVPPLVFESRPQLLLFLEQAKKWFATPKDFDLPIYEKHRKAVIDEEETHYGDYLAHAYLMALQMQWKTAAIFAARAREHVPPGPPVPNRSNGREAFYFEAFCRRYDAKKLDDLDKLEPLIARAESIAAEEIAFAEKEHWILNPVVERFEAERYALRMSMLLFQWREVDSKSKPDVLAQLAEMIPDFFSFHQRADRKIQELPDEKSGEGLNRHIPISKQREALRDVSVRALRNILAIGLQVPSARKQAEGAWRELLTIDNDRIRKPGSFISQFFYQCSLAHFGESWKERRDARRKIRNDFSEHVMEKNRVFPYDVERFLDIARQALKTV